MGAEKPPLPSEVTTHLAHMVEWWITWPSKGFYFGRRVTVPYDKVNRCKFLRYHFFIAIKTLSFIIPCLSCNIWTNITMYLWTFVGMVLYSTYHLIVTVGKELSLACLQDLACTAPLDIPWCPAEQLEG